MTFHKKETELITWMLFIGFLLSISIVYSAPTQFNITEDVILRAGASANTNQNGNGLSVKATSDASFCRMVILKANLSGYSGTIANAQLCLYITIQQAGQNVSAYNYSYGTSWDETTATFNNINGNCSNCLNATDSTNGQWKGTGQRYGTPTPTDTDVNTWKCINVTGVPKDYFSFVLVDDKGDNINWVGKDSENTTAFPYINLTGPVPGATYNAPANDASFVSTTTSVLLNATYIDPDGNNGTIFFYADANDGSTLIYNTTAVNNTIYTYNFSTITGNVYKWKVAVNNSANPDLQTGSVRNFTINMTNGTILFFDEGMIAWDSYGSRGNPSVRVDSNESARIFSQFPNPAGAFQPYNVSYMIYNITGNRTIATNMSILFANQSDGTSWIPETPQTFSVCGINYSVDGMMNSSNYDNQHKFQLRSSADGGLTYPTILNDSIFGATQANYFGYDAQRIDENNTWLYVATVPVSETAAVYRIIFNCSGINAPLNVFNESVGTGLTGRLLGVNVEKFGSTYYLWYGNSKVDFRRRNSTDGTTWSSPVVLFNGNSEFRNSVFLWNSQYFLFVNDGSETNITVYNMSSPTSFAGAVYQTIYYPIGNETGFYLGFDSVKQINATSFLMAVSNRTNRTILVAKWSTTALPTDTCTYSGSGTWTISMADYCVLSTPVELGANGILLTNTGNLTFNANINITGKLNVSNNQIVYMKPSGYLRTRG